VLRKSARGGFANSAQQDSKATFVFAAAWVSLREIFQSIYHDYNVVKNKLAFLRTILG
jgi:hypothetical protein